MASALRALADAVARRLRDRSRRHRRRRAAHRSARARRGVPPRRYARSSSKMRCAGSATTSSRTTLRRSSGAWPARAARHRPLEWCGGLAAGDEALEAQLRWEAGEEYPDDLAMHMWGEGERPEPERLRAGARTRAPPRGGCRPARCAPGPLATAAGSPGRSAARPTRDSLRAPRARDRPRARAGRDRRSFVRAGHLPDWAFAPRGEPARAT